MITPGVAVVGEALVDLIEQPDGDYRPHRGGSPYNVALALARQGQPIRYLSPLSSDRFGRWLAAGLEAAGVESLAPPSPQPTGLAVVAVDGQGQARYSFYREGVADRDVSAEALIAGLPAAGGALHTGSLAMAPDDQPRIKALLQAARDRGLCVCLDINMRPGAVPDRAAYVAGVEALLPLCHLVKCSDEDLAALGRGGDPVEAGRALQRDLEQPLVAITLGAAGAALVGRGAVIQRPAMIAEPGGDTVGAGDCFQAGLLSKLRSMGLLQPEALAGATAAQLTAALDHARATAALNVGRQGCDPPSAAEIAARLEADRVSP